MSNSILGSVLKQIGVILYKLSIPVSNVEDESEKAAELTVDNYNVIT